MAILWLLGRMTLVSLFGLAGMAKLLDQSGTRAMLSGFGVPPALLRSATIVLPMSELIVALLLAIPESVVSGALTALLLLSIFTGAMLAAVAQGRRPACRCFGNITASPVGWWTMGRNAAMAMCAVFIGWYRPESQVSAFELAQPFGFTPFMAVVAALGFSGTAWFSFHLLRQHGRLLLRLTRVENTLEQVGVALAGSHSATEGLQVGSVAPAFSLPSVSGDTVSLARLRAGGTPVLLVFWDPECAPCNAILPAVVRWGSDHSGYLAVVVVSRGSAHANQGRVGDTGRVLVLVQRDREVADRYVARHTPSAIVIREDGTVGSPMAVGAEAIAALVTSTVPDTGQPAGGSATADEQR